MSNDLKDRDTNFETMILAFSKAGKVSVKLLSSPFWVALYLIKGTVNMISRKDKRILKNSVKRGDFDK